ncbi:MAG: hypothetical protein WB762_16225 [Candidatus Sulfotelmatobacter sp.]
MPPYSERLATKPKAIHDDGLSNDAGQKSDSGRWVLISYKPVSGPQAASSLTLCRRFGG